MGNNLGIMIGFYWSTMKLYKVQGCNESVEKWRVGLRNRIIIEINFLFVLLLILNTRFDGLKKWRSMVL